MKNKIRKTFVIINLFVMSIALSSCGLFGDNSKKERIEAVYQSLFSKIDAAHIQKDFTLPISRSGVTISYESENHAVITPSIDTISNAMSFVVTRSSENQSVNLVVTLKYSEETVVKIKKLIVLLDSDETFDFIPYPFAGELTLLNKKIIDYIGFNGLEPLPNTFANKQKILVVPVQFSDDTFSNKELSDIEIAFNGTSVQTGYESVQSYYNKSSYGKLDIDATIAPTYEATYASSYYQGKYPNDPEQIILNEIMSYFNDSIDFSEYDNNNDGYIDGIYLIYSHEVIFGQLENDDPLNLWWAWCFQYKSSRFEKYDNVRPGFYVWSGVDFFYETVNSTKLNVNALVLIHETGHMLGLEDYYDYYSDVGPKGGLGSLDMMDENVGDHNSFSKIMLGWTTPMVINDSITVNIRPFSEYGDVLLIPAFWSESKDAYFSEYILIEYYSPSSIDALFIGNRYFSKSGIRMFHVSAELGKNTSFNGYGSLHLNDNSDSTYKLIRYLDASKNNEIENLGPDDKLSQIQIDNLLYNTLSTNILQDFKWYKPHDGTKDICFSISINKMNNNFAEISVTFNR